MPDTILSDPSQTKDNVSVGEAEAGFISSYWWLLILILAVLIAAVWKQKDIRKALSVVHERALGRKLTRLHCYVKRSPEHNVLGADDTFFKHVKSKMQRAYNTELVIVEQSEPLEIYRAPFIVICPVTSRVGSNIEHALRGLKCEENMALLLIHPVAKHVRPPRSTDESLADDRWQSLGVIVDVVYAPQEGFYDCDTNYFAVDKMCSFLRRYCTPPDESVEPLMKKTES